MEIKVMKEIMGSNQKIADENRDYFFKRRITAVNIMASPGAGKTSVITAIIEAFKDLSDIYVIEGDIASSIDSEKIEKLGVGVMQINTGGGCHLDANMIRESVMDLAISEGALLLVENVGNLICPSAFDLGESLKIVIASVPEGHDKPFKYTSMFEAADVIILNKIDLVPFVDFDRDLFYKGVRALNEKAPVFEISCRSGFGFDSFIKWLELVIKKAGKSA
jgi:hydrogenase nickel incorporation protein HypB